MVRNKRRLMLCLIIILGLLAPYNNSTEVHARSNHIVHYKIKKGDTFYLLSLRFNSTIKSISNMNPKKNPYNLIIGTKIKVPVGSGIQLHYVKKGDTLGNIAWKYNSTVGIITEKNNIINPNMIYPGDILSIPKTTLSEINSIVNDLNHSTLNQYSTLNARYENGWIKLDNIQFSPWVLYDMQMKVVHDILDKHNVKQIDYTVENVEWSQGSDGMIGTDHWGTVCIKVVKK